MNARYLFALAPHWLFAALAVALLLLESAPFDRHPAQATQLVQATVSSTDFAQLPLMYD